MQHRGIVSMSLLGTQGRLGNWLIQYGFLKLWARHYNLEVQTPNWIGRDLFGADDPPVSCSLPQRYEPAKSEFKDNSLELVEPCVNVDLTGWYQYHTSRYAACREYWRSLFQPTAAVLDKVNPIWERLEAGGRTVVAFHIRRTDYGVGIFYRTPLSWYHRWLEKHWSQLENPVLFLASDAILYVKRAFAKYKPVTARQLGARLPMAPYYPDHFLLSKAHQLVVANSSFSVSAAMLNENLRQAYRPELKEPLGDPPFRQFDPWNDVVLDQSAVAEDFPHLPYLRRPRGFTRFVEKITRSAEKRLERLGY